ncbi:MAG TPA: CinA family nicotinamide mononucleotide deamidase-related protein [Planctomycetaceae bacterium]|nr:CinA family nicotinamide mononucleotide deamidase-related protein [Planctomycetaceae bacterium]
MHAEIIAVGSELTSGASLDTNSQWLSQRLADAGVPVRRHTAVADEIDEMLAAFREAAARADVVIVTGGLGPTLDDLTRQALAALADVELKLHEPSLAFIREFFARRRRPMPERNTIQAMFPAGSEPIPNPRGTAPGIWMEHRTPGRERPCLIAALPGVPSEMKPMFEAQVHPRLAVSGRTIVRHEIHCFGAGESAIEELLGDLTARGRDPEVGITAHEATITLRIAAQGATPDECRAKVDAAATLIRERLGPLVFGEQGERLEQVVLRMLAGRGLTLATCEVGTAGLLAQWLTDVPDPRGTWPGHTAARLSLKQMVEGIRTQVATAPYRGGEVRPHMSEMAHIVQRAVQFAADERAAGRELAIDLATSCQRQFTSNFALAVTGWPDVDPDDPQSPVPTAWIALAGGDMLKTEAHPLLGDPAISRSRLAKAALNLLRLSLLGPPG